MAIKFTDSKGAKSSLSKGIQILNVYADWCGPCKMLAPILEEASSKIDVIKVNLDDNQDFAKEMGVTGVPTTFIYKDGKLKDQIVGFVPLNIIQDKVEQVAK